jgi:tetratricopeptide (TPR) repeat protein
VALHGLRGIFCMRQGMRAEAREAFRQAIRTSVDYDYAIHELLAASETHAERREAMRFVHQELMRQVTFGEGLLAFRDTAARVLEPEELLAILRDALAARRDLWHAWAALVRQLVDMNQLDEAHTLAQQAVERFPLLPALWIDLARVCRRRDDSDGEIAALKHAVELSPNWSAALCELADAYERGGQLDLAQEVLERAIARAPLIANTHVDLAGLLWRKGEQEKAFDRIRHAFELGPGSDQAWDRLCEWARKLERLELAVDAARQLAQRRPGEARSWLRLAQAYTRLPRYPDPKKEKQRIDDCLAAFDKAIALNPRNPDFYDQKAIALAQAQRWDEAFAACRPAPWGEEPPLTLRGRAAWLEAQQGRLDQAIERMRVVLQDDPKYYWGWSQRADWCQATARWPEYLEAANQMCKLAPHTAQPLAYRGEARLRTGDRAGGMDDLRAALKLGPDNPVAAFLVFDEHLNEGSLDDAETALAHLRQFIAGDYTTARAVQLRARQHKQDEAIAAFAQLCRSHEPATWPLDHAANVLAQAGWSAALKQTLRDAVRDADCHAHAAVVWGQHFDPRGDRDLDDCLAALDKAFARSSDYAALDLKAELLAMARRYDQALAVARAAADTPEFAIRARGRQAWIEKQRGRAEEAIDQMRQVVGDDPRYYWGWSQLADWYPQQGRRQDYLTAAEHLVELAPNNAWAFAHRGAARRDLGARERGKEDFVHAVNLAPGFEWVAFELFQMQFQDSEHEAAAETLNKIAGHIHPKEIARRQVQLAADMGDRQRAMEQITILADGSPDRSHTLAQAADTFFGARWSSELADALSARLDLADPAIGTAWVRALCGVHFGCVHGTVEKRLKQGHVSNQCLIGICDGLIAAKKPESVALVMKYGEKQLRADTWGWASMGRIFSKVHQDRRAATWMSDWAERDGVESWMLLNLAIALRGLGWLDEARRVHRHALEHAQPDATNAYHECWLVLDDALARRAEAVQDYLARGEPGGLDGYHYLIATCARALLVTITAPDKGYAFDEARHQLAQAARTIEPVDHDPALRKTYRRVVWQIAANCGGLRHRLWALWRMCRPVLPAVRPVG